MAVIRPTEAQSARLRAVLAQHGVQALATHADVNRATVQAAAAGCPVMPSNLRALLEACDAMSAPQENTRPAA